MKKALTPALLAFVALVGCGAEPWPTLAPRPRMTGPITRSTLHPAPEPEPEPMPDPPSGLVSINFDDGFESAYLNALPLFDAAGLKTTQFIISGFLGRPRYVTGEQVLDMARRGHEIASHTRTHPRLSTLSEAEQYEELHGSKQDLEALLGQAVSAFAYPYGDHDDASLLLVRQVGFTSGRSVEESVQNTATTDPFFLHSTSITDSSSMTRVLRQVGEAVANRTWLIITLHRVDEDGNAISIRHEKVEQLIQYLQEHQVTVVTTSEGLRRFGLR